MFPETLKLCAPIGLSEAIKQAARRRNTTAGEYVRQALLQTMRAEGLILRDGKVVALEPEVGQLWRE